MLRDQKERVRRECRRRGSKMSHENRALFFFSPSQSPSDNSENSTLHDETPLMILNGVVEFRVANNFLSTATTRYQSMIEETTNFPCSLTDNYRSITIRSLLIVNSKTIAVKTPP